MYCSFLYTVSEFLRLKSPLAWRTDAPFFGYFYDGLKEEIKDEISKVERPAIFMDYVKMASRIDQRLYERKMEKQNKYSSYQQPSFVKHHYNHPTSSSQSTPMELDKLKKLTQEEKQHRFNNKLCLYCGEAGHIVRSCPKKEKISSND